MPKSWTLTINNSPLTLTLTPPKQRGNGWACSLDNLYKLEKGDYQMEQNKKSIIRELSNQLNNYG
jgi:hypothetical protein